jgi:hypothetical protein
MQIKFENHTSGKLPPKTESTLLSVLGFLPREHTRGLERFKFVESINDPRVRSLRTASHLPALYHPKQGSQLAWAEIAVEVLIPSSRSFYHKILPRLTYKSNLAAIVISLVAQHYYVTLRHSIKKGHLESNVRTATALLGEMGQGTSSTRFKKMIIKMIGLITLLFESEHP